MIGDPKYPEGFAHYDYVNPDAPKGGTVRLSATGSFDTFNPILPKGNPASGINLIYGDSLKIAFNENGSSALQVVGVTFSAAGLGLASPTANAFQDNASINAVVGWE